MAKYYFECPECGYDSDEAHKLSSRDDGICPLCAGDTGRDVELRFRDATVDEGFHSKEERARKIKTGICQRLSKRQRAATPIEFRDLLISIAHKSPESHER